MTLQAAIEKRIMDLCEERKMTPAQLCTKADVPMHTLKDLFEHRHQDIRVSTIERLCDTLGISLADFFCCDIFRNIETE